MIEPLKHFTLDLLSMLLHVQLLFAVVLPDDENTPIQEESASELLPPPYATYRLSQQRELSDRSLRGC